MPGRALGRGAQEEGAPGAVCTRPPVCAAARSPCCCAGGCGRRCWPRRWATRWPSTPCWRAGGGGGGRPSAPHAARAGAVARQRPTAARVQAAAAAARHLGAGGPQPLPALAIPGGPHPARAQADPRTRGLAPLRAPAPCQPNSSQPFPRRARAGVSLHSSRGSPPAAQCNVGVPLVEVEAEAAHGPGRYPCSLEALADAGSLRRGPFAPLGPGTFASMPPLWRVRRAQPHPLPRPAAPRPLMHALSARAPTATGPRCGAARPGAAAEGAAAQGGHPRAPPGPGLHWPRPAMCAPACAPPGPAGPAHVPARRAWPAGGWLRAGAEPAPRRDGCGGTAARWRRSSHRRWGHGLTRPGTPRRWPQRRLLRALPG
jgi:hypothetical protein